MMIEPELTPDDINLANHIRKFWSVLHTANMLERAIAIWRVSLKKQKAEPQPEAPNYDADRWRMYEREYILPCFKWAKERGIDLDQLVREDAGKNCVQLLVEAAEQRATRIARLDEAKTIFTNWNVADRDFQYWLEQHIAKLSTTAQTPSEPLCNCGADRTGPSAEAHLPNCPAAQTPSEVHEAKCKGNPCIRNCNGGYCLCPCHW